MQDNAQEIKHPT